MSSLAHRVLGAKSEDDARAQFGVLLDSLIELHVAVVCARLKDIGADLRSLPWHEVARPSPARLVNLLGRACKLADSIGQDGVLEGAYRNLTSPAAMPWSRQFLVAAGLPDHAARCNSSLDALDSMVWISEQNQLRLVEVPLAPELLIEALDEIVETLGVAGRVLIALTTEGRDEDTAEPNVVKLELGDLGTAGEGKAAAELEPNRAYAVLGEDHLDLSPFLTPHQDDAGNWWIAFLSQMRGEISGDTLAYREPISGAISPLNATISVAQYITIASGIQTAESTVRDLSAAEAVRLPAQEVLEPATRPRVGEFELVSLLGKGGMSEVHAAWQPSVGRMVALKVLPPDLCRNPVLVARFKCEVLALGMCTHPNVVVPYTTGSDRDEGGRQRHFYAMELIRGSNLSQVLRGLLQAHSRGERLTAAHVDALAGSPTRDNVEEAWDAGRSAQAPILEADLSYYHRVTRLIAQAARGVAELHSKGVVHRDIKPGNIMVNSVDGRAVTMDLGLARLWNADLSLGTKSLMVLGTLRYMPPEQLGKGAHSVSPRVDVYSLGVCLFELATLSPFRTADSYLELTHKLSFETPPDPRTANSAIPESLANIIVGATRQAPSERVQTARELAELLESHLAGHVVQPQGSHWIEPDAAQSEITTSEYRAIASAISLASSEAEAYLARRRYAGSRYASKLNRATDLRLRELRRPPELAQAVRAILGAATVKDAEKLRADAPDSLHARELDQAARFASDLFTRSHRITNTLGIEFLRMPAGSFEMGDPDFQDNPVHRVHLTQAVYLGVYPVTNAQWRLFRAGHDSGEIDGLTLDGDDQPAVHINWMEAAEFCRWLSEREGRKYRLPTEAEWEYAARAGRANAESRFPWSNGPPGNLLAAQWPPSGNAGNYADESMHRALGRGRPRDYHFDDGYPVSSPVGRFAANPWDLNDIGGNVWEWCHDWYDPFACQQAAMDPTGPTDYTIGMYKVARGASFENNDRKGLMTAARVHFDHSARLHNLGLRVLLEINPK